MAKNKDMKQDLRNLVLESLKKRILKWEYPPGYRLAEGELCKEYGVSRSPVRDALHRLEADGLVSRSPHRGYVINQPGLKGAQELYEIRLALELFVVERLCEGGVPKVTLNQLKRTWNSVLKKSEKTSDEFAAMDREFHEILASEIENETLLKELRSINDRISIFRVLDFEKNGRFEDTCKQHLEILKRVSERDVNRARNAMQVNIEEGYENVAGVLKEALAKAFVLNGRRM